MVKGLDVFRDCFRDYADKYILIGGTACDLAMEEAGLSFRATKDLDIVLCIEVLDRDFVKLFWDFIYKGGYKIQEKASGKKQFYRFAKPVDEHFPFMLELFSRKPDALAIAGKTHLTPIPVDDEIASLSAILLDDVYYGFIMQGKRQKDGLSIIGPEHLIPLKARAWMDLSQRKQQGENIDSKNIRKHINDVFRLYQVAEPGNKIALPASITTDLKHFIDLIGGEVVDLHALGFRSANLEAIIDDMRKMYGVG